MTDPHTLLRTGRLGRVLYTCLGLLFVALGLIGAMLPVMPTTIFLILAAWCFARSSPKLEGWLLDHPQFGPVLRAWRKDKAIPRKGKIMACIGMATGFAIFLFAAHPALWLMLLIGAIMVACALFVVTRPAPGVP
ncbi:Inner membrane protein YbaN (plasmid) [Asticcacaulis sp. MM231]|uniref:YbaN family protein n=1 Tax=Asticcacaulis sp. MM231 TaxID=3157666 RepID=UPI0032D56A6C